MVNVLFAVKALIIVRVVIDRQVDALNVGLAIRLHLIITVPHARTLRTVLFVRRQNLTRAVDAKMVMV